MPQVPATKTLARSKSLTRILSTSSRNSSDARHAVPDHKTFTPPTPHVPAQFQPSSTQSVESQRVSETEYKALVQDSIHQGISYSATNGDGLGIALDSSQRQRVFDAKLDDAADTVIYKRSRSKTVGAEADGTPRTASIVAIRPLTRPRIYYSPTFPVLRVLPNKSEVDERVPNASEVAERKQPVSSSISRKRSASASVSKSSTSHTPIQSVSMSASSHESNMNEMVSDGRPHESKPSTGPATFSEDWPLSPPQPWQTVYGDGEIRSSVKSAGTTGSSHVGTMSTRRSSSSVTTKGTSITEPSIDPPSRPASKYDGMTVDDAIDMYAAGFWDDAEDDANISRDSSISGEEHRRYDKVAEAVTDVKSLPVITRAGADEFASSDLAIPVSSNIRSFPARDQYGFSKTSFYINHAQYDAWHTEYQPAQQRRANKWSTYMREQNLPAVLPQRFPSRSVKTQRFIRKGVPPAWRGAAWFFYAGGDAYIQRYPHTYTLLDSQSEADLSDHDKEAIERDLHRTFPDNVHFKPDISSGEDTPLLASLRRVLRAFALHSPKIGYCQSLNFIAGLLLLFMTEEKAFWMLHIITTDFLPGTHELSLEGANIDLWVLMVALKSMLPSIWTKVASAGTSESGNGLRRGSANVPPISLCTTSWFMSLFIGTLPIESTLRVWDVLFYEGSRTLFRVALTIFKLGESKIKNVNDPMELFQVVQAIPRGLLDASALLKVMCRRGGVGGEWVERRRKQRRIWFAKERNNSLALAAANDPASLSRTEDEAQSIMRRDTDAASAQAGDDTKRKLEKEGSLVRSNSMWRKRRPK